MTGHRNVMHKYTAVALQVAAALQVIMMLTRYNLNVMIPVLLRQCHSGCSSLTH